jgi:hypothetical protein
MTTPTVAVRSSIRRTVRLTRCNVVLLFRSRLAFFYAVLMPLLPLALLFTGERGSPAVGAFAIVIMFQAVALFPVYYTTCSAGPLGHAQQMNTVLIQTANGGTHPWS